MSHDYLFVYGTLRRDTNSEMYHLLARYGRLVDDATYQGKLYMVDYYPEIVLLKLDDYEVCGPKFPEPNEYVRRKEKVTLKSGKIVSAWIYIFDRPTNDAYYCIW